MTLALGATLVPSPAGAGTEQKFLSDTYCAALADYFTVTVTVELSVQLFMLFSSLPGTTAPGSEPPPDEETLRAGFYVVVSPKMEAAAAKLSRSGPKVLRPAYRALRDTFAKGVDALSDADFTEEQIEAIANADVTAQTTDISEIAPDVELDDATLAQLAEGFREDLAELDTTFPAEDERAEEVFNDTLLECGVVTDTEIDCDEVLTEDDAAQILEEDELTLDDESGCAYAGPEPVDGQTAEVAVVVYRSARAYERITANLDTEELQGIGDEAVTVEGFSSDGRDVTCGRTLFAVEDDNVVNVALCLGGDDPPVSNDLLAQIADQVLQNLS